MKKISINGYALEAPLLAEDPDVKRTVPDASGQLRHIRAFSQPGRLKSYLKKHPEGLILAGAGGMFFLEPVPVTAAMIRFDDSGNVNILIRDEAERIESQLKAMMKISTEALEALDRY